VNTETIVVAGHRECCPCPRCVALRGEVAGEKRRMAANPRVEAPVGDIEVQDAMPDTTCLSCGKDHGGTTGGLCPYCNPNSGSYDSWGPHMNEYVGQADAGVVLNPGSSCADKSGVYSIYHGAGCCCARKLYVNEKLAIYLARRMAVAS
jgi:hypothetical protein